MDGCEDEANIDLPVWVLNVFTILLGFGLAFTHALERAAKSIFTYQSNTRYKRGHHACANDWVSGMNPYPLPLA